MYPQLAITLKVINGLYPGVTTVELDTLAAETAACMTTDHPDYAILAARIAVSNLHKETKKQFSGKWYSSYCAISHVLSNQRSCNSEKRGISHFDDKTKQTLHTIIVLTIELLVSLHSST